MSQGEFQLSHIIDAAERWATQTDEHSVDEHTGQITYLRELVESAMEEQGNSMPMHLLKSGIIRPLATLQRQLAYMVAQSTYQDPEQAALYECTLVMILLFQISPSASEAVLGADHTRSFFECVLRDYFHHDVRTISAMMLERIAAARQRGGSLLLPPESLFSLASRIEEQLASAKQYGLQTGMVSLLVKAAEFHAPCSKALQGLQSRFGNMVVDTPTGELNPRLLLANFNQQTAESHVYSFVPRRLVVFGGELRRDQLDYIDWNWDDVRFPAPYPSGGQIEVQLGDQDIASCKSEEDGTGLLWLVLHLQPEKLRELQLASTSGPHSAISVLLEREQLRTVHSRFLQRLPQSLQLGGMASRVAQPEPASRSSAGVKTPLKSSMTASRSAAAGTPVATAAAAAQRRIFASNQQALLEMRQKVARSAAAKGAAVVAKLDGVKARLGAEQKKRVRAKAARKRACQQELMVLLAQLQRPDSSEGSDDD